MEEAIEEVFRNTTPGLFLLAFEEFPFAKQLAMELQGHKTIVVYDDLELPGNERLSGYLGEHYTD